MPQATLSKLSPLRMLVIRELLLSGLDNRTKRAFSSKNAEPTSYFLGIMCMSRWLFGSYLRVNELGRACGLRSVVQIK